MLEGNVGVVVQEGDEILAGVATSTCRELSWMACDGLTTTYLSRLL